MTIPESDFPVFVVGAPRSGTTLVYSLLMASGDFVTYEEGETRLLQCRAVYGPLDNDTCFRRFADDWLRSLQFRRSRIPEEAFRKVLKRTRTSYVELLRTFMSRMAKAQDKPRWAEKTPSNVHYMRELAEAFPSARFVHVIRDGRDVALSRRKLGWHVVGSSDPVRQLIGAASHWAQLVRIGRAHGGQLENRYMEIQYERLIADPATEGGRLAEFVRADLAAAWEKGSNVGALGSGFSAYSEEVSGLSNSPVQRWRRTMDESELAAVNAAVGPILHQLGYAVDTPAVPARVRLAARSYAAWVAASLRARRWIKHHTPIRRLVAPKLLDFESG